MPLIRAKGRLIYYAHVPKCAGSAVEDYLTERFGPLAFCDTSFLKQEHPWTRTSPQHVDRAAFTRLFPPGFVDASFAIVRHPVDRIVSSWHFQLEVEKTVPDEMSFSDWLARLPELWAKTPYIFDNHTKPMDEIVPNTAQVFYLEHGLDAIIPWLDAIIDDQSGPRVIKQINAHGSYVKTKIEKVAPSEKDLDVITHLYKMDFERFGYDLDEKLPRSPAPVLDAQAHVAAHAARPQRGLIRKILKRL